MSHISLSNKTCIFCQQIPEPGEEIVTILGCAPTKGYTSPYLMPSIGQKNIKHQEVHINTETLWWRLCLRSECDRCLSSPQSILYHPDCYEAFRQLLKSNDKELSSPSHTDIFEIGSLLNPWLPPREKLQIYTNTVNACQWWSWELKKISDLSTEPSETSIFVALLSELPPEILALVLAEGGIDIYRSGLIRYILVTQVANALSGRTDLVRIRRGKFVDILQPVQLFGNQYARPKDIVNLVKPVGVDHLGIRLKHDGCPWYIQNHELELCYKDPFLRPSLSQPIELWDIPRRPKEPCWFYTGKENKHKHSLRQIRCINFSDIVGLTVCCSGRATYGIHAHKSPQSSAVDTYSCLSPQLQEYALLRYLPLNTNHETINEIWIRESEPFPERTRSIMIRTPQRTEIFGPGSGDRKANYVQLMDGPVTALLYYVPAYGDPISVFGAASNFPVLRKYPNSPAFHDIEDPLMHHSQVTLDKVAHVDIYIHPLEDARCSGLLLTHDDGREETLGQRRMGLPDIETISIARPYRLHYKPFRTPNDHRRLKVMFSSEDDPKSLNTNDGWFSEPMTGTVIWSFDWRDDVLTYERSGDHAQ